MVTHSSGFQTSDIAFEIEGKAGCSNHACNPSAGEAEVGGL
jgi:hypothetical protein